MTAKIKATIIELNLCIDLIKQNGRDWVDERDIPRLQTAVRSLEAWDSLMEEMEQEINYYDSMPDIWYGISKAFDIIKKHRKEVEK